MSPYDAAALGPKGVKLTLVEPTGRYNVHVSEHSYFPSERRVTCPRASGSIRSPSLGTCTAPAPRLGPTVPHYPN